MNKKTIPILTCFDNNYVIPASVCFYSLLKNANYNYHYAIYVLQNDITLENKEKLQETISYFSNASLEFINMNNKFDDLFEKTKTKGHYSKEMFYKFLAPSIFPQYEKIIITDVDVIFLRDISEEFVKFDVNSSNYLKASRPIFVNAELYKQVKDAYKEQFNEDEIQKLGYAAGYYIYNLNNMRRDNIEEKLIDFALKNSYRIRQPEQDTISLVCANKISLLPVNSLVCTYAYTMFKNEEDMNNDIFWNKEDVKFALEKPVQLHYATKDKPWKNPYTIKGEIWYEYLKNTPFYFDFIKNNVGQKTKYKIKNLFSLKFKSKRIKLICEKEV